MIYKQHMLFRCRMYCDYVDDVCYSVSSCGRYQTATAQW